MAKNIQSKTLDGFHMKKIFLVLAVTSFLTTKANAFFFILPIPNISKPPELEKLIDALEKSNDTKAVAYVSEDKTFGAKMWAWGHYAGKETQEYANSQALRTCENSLASNKRKTAGGQAIYDFGNKKCELHKFNNVTLNLPDAPPVVQNAQTKSPSTDESPTAKRLKELELLLAQNLITKDEYDKKRREIIDGM